VLVIWKIGSAWRYLVAWTAVGDFSGVVIYRPSLYFFSTTETIGSEQPNVIYLNLVIGHDRVWINDLRKDLRASPGPSFPKTTVAWQSRIYLLAFKVVFFGDTGRLYEFPYMVEYHKPDNIFVKFLGVLLLQQWCLRRYTGAVSDSDSHGSVTYSPRTSTMAAMDAPSAAMDMAVSNRMVVVYTVN